MSEPERDYLFDPRGIAPGEGDELVVELEERLAVLRAQDADGGRRTADSGQRTADGGRRTAVRPVYIAAFALAAAALAAVGVRYWKPAPPLATTEPSAPAATASAPPAPAFAIAVDGKPGRLDRGTWLETRPGSKATIHVADIGTVELAPESRLRLVNTSPAEHRLELAQGKLSAVVVAPPRLFVVDTEAASAVDLGCSYRLEVGKNGEGRLEVDTGAVSLEGHGRTSWVPAGAACETMKGRGPGTPYLVDTRDAVAADLRAFDWGDGRASRAAVDRLLSRATARYTLMMWHMVSRVGADQRAGVVKKLSALAALPPGTTREELERLDPAALGRYRDEIQAHW